MKKPKPPVRFVGKRVVLSVEGPDGKFLDFDLTGKVGIDMAKLDGELQFHSSKYSWLCTLLEIAKDKRRHADLSLKRARSEAELHVRSNGLEGIKGRITEKAIEAAVFSNPKVEEATRRCVELSHQIG